MTNGGNLKRRGFIAGALLGLGGVGGWIIRRLQLQDSVRQPAATALDSRFVYDVSEFEKTDPALLRYAPAHEFPTGFDRVKCMTVAGNKIWVAGDRSAKLFHSRGRLEKEISLDRPPHCLHVSADDELFVGLANFFEVYDSAGKRRLRTPRLAENTFLTAMALHEDRVYLADAGEREILVCDRKSGSVLDRFGRRDQARNNPGLVVPSPYLDLAMASDGRLRVANPGRLRVETYSPDGRFESSWGEPGMRIDRFCGCCNPAYFTLTPDDNFITSEKGLARINVYGSDGTFKGAVAGPEELVKDKELAKRACADCRVGAGFDVALDDRGSVLALDPFAKAVRCFSPLESA